ncbi:MAG TPA: hypothetical protein PK263_02695 [bacterium]|nr:hypothetical protein [bacterium]
MSYTNRSLRVLTVAATSIIVLASAMMVLSFFSIIKTKPAQSSASRPKYELKSEIFERIVTPADNEKSLPLDDGNFGRENPFEKVGQ